jgi:uncharacterized protein YraI
MAVSFLMAGCSVQIQTDFTGTNTPVVITVTLPPTLTPHPSETSLPPSSTPTVVPVEGTTSTQLNVRAEPSTTSGVLGIIAVNTKVQITGTDPGGNWWQILYESGADGKGWVTAQFVETTVKPEVPVIGGGEAKPNEGDSAVVIQQLNIRSGPGTSFDSLGILNTNDVVTLTGRNRDGTWLEISFQGGPNGRGWVSSGFVRAENAEALPIVSDTGEVIGTGTPADTPLPPTPTVVPAPMDNDSAENPIWSVTFDRAGTNTLIFTGDVSTPVGDAEDWIEVTPYGEVVYIRLECNDADLVRGGVGGSDAVLLCNDSMRAFPVQAGMPFLVHVQAVPGTDSLEYSKYVLTIKANP